MLFCLTPFPTRCAAVSAISLRILLQKKTQNSTIFLLATLWTTEEFRCRISMPTLNMPRLNVRNSKIPPLHHPEMNKLNSWNSSYVLRRVMMKEQRKRPKKLEIFSCEQYEKWELRLYNSNRLIIAIKWDDITHTKAEQMKIFLLIELYLRKIINVPIDSDFLSVSTTAVIFPHERWLLNNCVWYIDGASVRGEKFLKILHEKLLPLVSKQFNKWPGSESVRELAFR